MKLGCFIIDGQVCGVQKKYWTDTEIGANVPFIFCETIPEGYSDQTNIEALDTLGFQVPGYDYKHIRSMIKEAWIIIAGESCENWASLTTAQKLIGCKYVLPPTAKMLELLTIAEILQNSLIFDDCAVLCRSNRAMMAKSYLHAYLEKTDWTAVLLDLYKAPSGQAFPLIELYIAGIDGTIEGDREGLLDYVNARVGTSYELTGLAVKGYTTKMGTLSDLVTAINEILTNGLVD